jgi:Family of unknown function (DUF6152)
MGTAIIAAFVVTGAELTFGFPISAHVRSSLHPFSLMLEACHGHTMWGDSTSTRQLTLVDFFQYPRASKKEYICTSADNPKEHLMGKIRPIYLILLFGLSFAPQASAHHGYAAYDMTKTITVNGTVTEMAMANPHSSLTFDVKDEKGDVSRWAIEFGTLRGLIGQGWTKDTLKPGDGITLSLHPAKNGAHVGVLVGKITYADGRPLPVKSTPSE